MISKAAVSRLAPLVRSKLSGVPADRWDKTLAVVGDDGRAVLADVLAALYPDLGREAALTAFRQFRREVSLAAKEAGVRMSIKTDGQTRRAPGERAVWFEGEDRVVEEVKRLVGAEVEGVDRSPQNALDSRPVRFFVSYAHEDANLKDRLLGKLLTCLATHPDTKFELWTDGDIQLGKKWLDEIRKAMEECDFGLLLVSPAFLASEFITKTELPHLLEKKRVIPVALKPVLFDSKKMGLKGLEERQIFFDRGHKEFSVRTTDATRDAFVLQLFERVCDALGERPKPQKPTYEHYSRSAVEDFDAEHFVPTEGVATTLSKGLDATPEIDASRRKDAIEFLTEWIDDEKAPPYCALLGEYGMGKTTTCKALARELLQRREKDGKTPLPIYLDLRNVGESAKRDLTLEEILETILKRSWKSGPDGSRVAAQELIKLVQDEGALVIWDGLDEVLVHLDPHPGQMFTRQLFRILPPAVKGEARRGRMLVSCRTHYFRTLRDQQTHFRAEDRDNVRAEDYRAPFVLLPFTEDQIRKYIAATLPDENTGRVMEVLRSVHNLTEMAQRPYTLSLIAQEFAQIERWKAEGRRVTGLMLYRHMVLSWLERDTGKHQITPDHKQRLMEQLAAGLWRAGAKSWRVEELEQWLIDFLEGNPGVAAHYAGKARELLKEDLRTATFLVREGEEHFRFAHTSLQEYFLAGYLRRALVEGRVADWAMKRVSRETLDFLGQWIGEDGGSEHRPMACATESLGKLRDAYCAQASEMAFDYVLLANRKGYPAPSAAGFQLPGADLTEWEIEGSAGAPLVLVGINLRGARLWNSRWKHCNLQGAALDGADAMRAEWLDCYLAESSWRGAALEATVFRDCELGRTNFEESRSRRTQWLRCRLAGAMGLPAEGGEARYALCDGNGGAAVGEARLTTAEGHRGGVNGCAWSPDGLRVVSASYDNTLRLWDAASGACVATLTGHSRGVMGCAWSPDGLRVVSASDDNTLRLWDAASGACVATLTGHSGGVMGCAWSPDGLRVVSASYDNSLRLWDAASGACVAILTGHSDWVRGCAWSPDGLRVVSASDDNTLRLWDAASGACLATLTGHSSLVMGCAWSPDGLRVVSASDDNTLRLWDAASGGCVATLTGHSDWVRGCAWSPDGLRVVSASDDNTLRLWDAASGGCVATLTGHSDGVNGCAWSPDGLRVVSASDDNTLRLWDAASGACLATLTGHSSRVRGCAWSPDGLRVVSASSDNTLRLWDAASGACVATLTGHSSLVRGCAWSPDGLRVVSASDDNTLRLWDAASGACVATLTGHSSGVNGCAWSPDGLRVVSASYDKTLRLWDAASGACVATLTGHSRGVIGCAWSPDGLRVVSASDDHTLRLWDAASGACMATLTGHSSRVRGCAWSPDGLRVVSASWDNTLRLWDAASGACVATLTGHSRLVMGCAWSPDGLRVVSASDDHTLRLWDAVSGACVATLTGHSGGVSGCAWSPDGLRVVSASYDSTIRIWNTATGIELAPRMYHLRTPHDGLTWCSIDHRNNRILACGTEAWRVLGWVVRDPVTGWPEMLPAETFGPLLVVEAGG